MSDEAHEVQDLNRRWMDAYVQRDAAFLERYLASSYVSTFPDGTVLDKNGEIEALKSGEVLLNEMTALEMNAHLYGAAVAVITGRSTIKAELKGEQVSSQYRFTDIWVKQGGQWLAVASQVTRIAGT
jgi:ketosteroid isomerase-like protein